MNLEDVKGDWALITGASAGIGREFALQLAASGMNLVLVARRGQLLRALEMELTQRYGIGTVVVPADLSQDSVLSEIKSLLEERGIKIRLLVNNAAVGSFGRFEATPYETYEKMISLNVTAVVSMCHHFLQDLTSFPTSAIINVSSPGAYNPVPYMAVYAATKAFISNFSQALYGEWKERGVLVQTLVPGPTETEFDAIAGVDIASISKRERADAVVKASLENLAGDLPVVVSAKGTYKQRLFVTLCPPKLVINTIARMFRPPEGK